MAAKRTQSIDTKVIRQFNKRTCMEFVATSAEL